MHYTLWKGRENKGGKKPLKGDNTEPSLSSSTSCIDSQNQQHLGYKAKSWDCPIHGSFLWLEQEKLQDVEAGNESRRDLSVFEWLFVPPCRAELRKAPTGSDCAEVAVTNSDNTRGQDWEMTRCVPDGSAIRPWRGQWLCPRKVLRRAEGSCECPWAWQDKQRQLGRHIHPLPTPPRIQHPAQLFPLSLTSFPTAAALPDSKPFSRASSRSECIC